MNLSYECLTSLETRQALVGLCNTNLALYEQLSTPLPSAPIPPPLPGTTEIYPEDQEDEDDMPVDLLLLVDDIVAQVTGEARDCQGHSSLDAPSELNPPQRIPSPLFIALLVPQAEG